MIPCACLAGFLSVQSEDGEARLVITTSDGRRFEAPRQGEQDQFFTAKISADGKYVGWEAGYPGLGASYSMSVHLTVLDEANRLHNFSGEFGVVYDWCFPSQRAGAVVFSYAFPHGTNMRQFEMRRIEDHRLMASYTLPHEERARAKAVEVAPQWLRCVPDWTK